ncbi:glycoside hydrolase family 31 protein [Tenacibaculum jejuense]|uniref:Glycoside hydrolase, family 31 n=1 Tax=Tenacibaculum jejuense TaxID=584609 RepID=A0A238U9T8_9FLAO|nr:TIM-barrel domain-containing protein [Tenacibaculum jejuense]SNR15825.1 Glycoside hydrolase, family 31 [Tenacibaculum jejuense]
MKKLFFILFCVQTFVYTQNSSRIFKEASVQNGDILTVKVNDGTYKIRFYSSQIIETSFIPKEETFSSTSHAVIKQPDNVDIYLNDSGEKVIFKTKTTTVEIIKSPFQIKYYHNGNLITSEKKGFHKKENNDAIELNLTSEEVLYGTGARALGMNRRGNKLQLYNRAHYGYETRSELMNFTMPVVVSSKKYMIHFDNAPIGYLDLDSEKNNSLTYETISGRKTYQIIVGDTWYELLDNYTDLTGKQPMIPRWSLGNFSSRFGYHSEKETRNTIQAFKNEKIPVDAVILDLYWFGKDIKGTMGNLEVFKDSFPNMKKMVSDFKKEGVKTVLITEPFILTTSKKWDEAKSKGILGKDEAGNPFTYDFYFGNTGLIDIYNPEGNKWFWNIYKGLKDMGVEGFWGDLGEPEVHPSKLLHATGTADEVHNIYGHDWAKLIYDGYKTNYPNERPFILMRAGYSGSQRFGLIPWSGDVNRTWGGLQSQPEIALQMGMQGLSYMHSDLGGFAGANLDDELYVRWLQYGVFQPIFRPHAQEEVPSEPVFRADKAKALAKKAIELRYQLLPYNYNLVFENNQKGKPLMRPLFFEDNTTSLFTNSTSYLWGNDFLISPILKAKQTEQRVYFPKNHYWFNFYSDELEEGGKSKDVKTTEENIPTYVKAGSFIPLTSVVQTTKEYSLHAFDLHYYHHATVTKSSRELYNDDGVTANAFEKKQYEILKFSSKTKQKSISIQLKAQIGENFKKSKKEINLIVHNIKSKPKKVKTNNKKVEFTWDSTKNQLVIPVQWDTSKSNKITIKL